jgi:hypothetical protein
VCVWAREDGCGGGCVLVVCVGSLLLSNSDPPYLHDKLDNYPIYQLVVRNLYYFITVYMIAEKNTCRAANKLNLRVKLGLAHLILKLSELVLSRVKG